MIPRLALALVALALAARALPASELDAVWSETGLDRVAVQDEGIVKTLATFARDHMLTVTAHRLTEGDDPITLTLQLLAEPGALADRFLVPVDGDALIPHLEAQGVEVEDRAIRLGDAVLIDPASGRLLGQGGRAFEIAMATYMVTDPELAGQMERAPFLEGVAAAQFGRDEHGHVQIPENAEDLNVAAGRLLTRVNTINALPETFRLVPHPVDRQGLWTTVADLPSDEAIVREHRALLAAVSDGDADAARDSASALAEDLRALPNYPSGAHLAIDHAYTTKRPYHWATRAYLAAAVLFFISLVTGGVGWWRAAFALMAGGFVVHALGAVARGYLLQRVPLSNLYEATTTGIGFVILVALGLELFHRMKVVGMMSGLLAFIYHSWLLSSDTYGRDEIAPLRAVLDSYWLDYHVTCMILSYGAFTVSFGMALLYLARAHFPRAMGWTPPLKDLELYNHRAIQVGWPLLGIGVVLGAIWADTAWGRMWSWDPKETWALITWLIYTGYIHMRFVAGASGPAMAWFSIAGYACVMFTYLGVNFVLSGLHSYAGNDPIELMSIGEMLSRHWWVGAAGLITVGGLAATLLLVRRRGQSSLAVSPAVDPVSKGSSDVEPSSDSKS